MILDTEEIESELEPLPVGLGATVTMGEEGFPEIYTQVSPAAEGFYKPPNLRTRFVSDLVPIRAVCAAATESGYAVALVRTGEPLLFLWKVEDLRLDG